MSKYEELVAELAPREFKRTGVIWTVALVVVVVVGIAAYIDQIIQGQVVTNMRDYVLWGVYISNFVFFVAISFVGSLTAAVLRLTKKAWRTPLVRIAEIIAFAAILMAGITIILDMGRPDRLLNLFIHGRLQSPITWDVIIITTYIAISVLILFIPLLPDLAILKDRFKDQPFLAKLYKFFSLNWSGTQQQWFLQSKSIQMVAILIIPVAFVLQTVDAWLFSTTFRIGWDSTNFGPYFIAGAFVVGTGALITITYVLRKSYKLEKYITELHFDKLGKLLAFACLIYLYFNINEYLLPAFTAPKAETLHLNELFFGHYAPLFWFVTVGGLIIPVLTLIFPKGRKPLPLFLIAILVVVTSWWKRYLIVVPALLHPFLPIQGVPEQWHSYFPSMHEWAIISGTLAAALLIITILVRYLPIIPIYRTAKEQGILENENTEQS
ncbi:MAG: polysulfide reductase NrfD [Cyclobacteriaceae bacterium]|nr:polysulfide reductase NrfD [Cyclobacteriaceae bacterium]